MTNKKMRIGIQLAPQYGDMDKMRKAWVEADAMGADTILTADHFHAQVFSTENIKEATHSSTSYGKNFEATTVQAAMAATTQRAEIGCLVHANSYRNPNLMADIARTIDHISNGRFLLGMGAGYLQPDYDEYGYEYGTAKSRMEKFAHDLPIIEARFEKLNPKPTRRIPLMIAAMGENLGMRLVAKHADIWHVYGDIDKLTHKAEVMRGMCREIGRDPETLEFCTSYVPNMGETTGSPDAYRKLGFTHILATAYGPDWDLGLLRELLQWRAGLS